MHSTEPIHVTKNNKVKYYESGVSPSDQHSCSLLFCWEVPLDRKRAGCSRRRLRVEHFFIQGREVIPSMQKNTKETFPSPSVSQCDSVEKAQFFSLESHVYAHETARSTHIRRLNIHGKSSCPNNVLFRWCSLYWRRWRWWHDMKNRMTVYGHNIEDIKHINNINN